MACGAATGARSDGAWPGRKRTSRGLCLPVLRVSRGDDGFIAATVQGRYRGRCLTRMRRRDFTRGKRDRPGRKENAMHDTVIRGGSIIDGTGSPAFIGDVAIDGDRITQVGGKAGP